MGKFASRCLAAAGLVAIIWRAGVAAQAEELVRLDSAVRRGAATTIDAYLTRPKGKGPGPAVVLLHSCLGLPSNRQAIGETIAGFGYVALFVDDFATRGLKETCAVDFDEALPDAVGALDYLSRLPFVDRTRIAAVGYSQGGDTALKIAARPLAGMGDLKFAAAAAFYPPCANMGETRFVVPTLILVGASDDVTPATDCERLAKAQPSGRSQVKLVVYQGAYHGFDMPGFGAGTRVLGMRLQYDRKATQQSLGELRAFLAANLSR